jgi:hypothetical protein
MVRGRYSIQIPKAECRSDDVMRTSLLQYDIRIVEFQMVSIRDLVGVFDNCRVLRDPREHGICVGSFCQASVKRIEQSFDIEKLYSKRIGLEKPAAVHT